MSRRKKRSNSIIYLIFAIAIIILSALGIDFYGIFAEEETINVVSMENLNNVTIKTGKKITKDFISENNENLKVYFFDVGQADSILIQNENETILIDAGNNEDGDLLVKNLQELQIEKIDYLKF